MPIPGIPNNSTGFHDSQYKRKNEVMQITSAEMLESKKNGKISLKNQANVNSAALPSKTKAMNLGALQPPPVQNENKENAGSF